MSERTKDDNSGSKNEVKTNDLSDNNDDDDPINYFESSLETLFGQHQPATGNPGELCTLRLDKDDEGKEEIMIRYRIPFSQTNKLFAHYQWDSGLFLCHLIYRSSSNSKQKTSVTKLNILDSFDQYRPEVNMKGQSVLELGAGTGLPSLISAKYGGASNVLVTDYPDESILNALKENVLLSSSSLTKIQVKGLDWSNEKTISEIIQENPLKFQRILCADVLWLSSSHQSLLKTIRNLLAFNKSSRCILVSGFHTGRRALSRFFDLACSSSDDVDSPRLIPSKDIDGNQIVYEYNVVTKQARQWSGTKPFLSNQEDDQYDNMDDFSERTKWLLYVCLQWEL